MTNNGSTYGVAEFITDAKRIMEKPGGVRDREAAVHELEPLLRRALDGPGWEDPQYATITGSGRPGFLYYRNPETDLHIYSVLFSPDYPTSVHDHVTWGIIGVYSGKQRTTRYHGDDDGSVPGQCTITETADEVLTHGATYPLLPPHDIHRIEVVSDEPGLSVHVLGADLKRQRRRIFDVGEGRCEEVEGVSMAR